MSQAEWGMQIVRRGMHLDQFIPEELRSNIEPINDEGDLIPPIRATIQYGSATFVAEVAGRMEVHTQRVVLS